MKILVVEDNAAMRAMIRLMLAQPGDEVRECAEGAEALAAYAEFQPEWVTMDIQLGAADGFDVTSQITARFPSARVIILTQHDSDGYRAAAVKAGAWAYVLKDNLADVRACFRNPPNNLSL